MDTSSSNLRGIGFMLIAMGAFIINDTVMKAVGASYTVGQAVFLRGVLASILIFVLAWRAGALKALPTLRHPLVGLRTVAELAATLTYLHALFNMPIANATAILQAGPLIITLIAAVFLREPVGWRRWSAILVGFVGVLVIVRPGMEGFTGYSVFAVVSVLFVAVRDLSTRYLHADIPAVLVTVVTAVAVTLSGGVMSMFGEWRPVSLTHMVLFALSSGFLVAGYFFAVKAMREGEISVVSPFRYSIMIWAILLGIFAFGTYPDLPTLIGTGIIVATGIFTLYRERVVAARQARKAPPIPPRSI